MEDKILHDCNLVSNLFVFVYFRISGDTSFLESMNISFVAKPKSVDDEFQNLDVKSIAEVFCLEVCFLIVIKKLELLLGIHSTNLIKSIGLIFL